MYIYIHIIVSIMTTICHGNHFVAREAYLSFPNFESPVLINRLCQRIHLGKLSR